MQENIENENRGTCWWNIRQKFAQALPLNDKNMKTNTEAPGGGTLAESSHKPCHCVKNVKVKTTNYAKFYEFCNNKRESYFTGSNNPEINTLWRNAEYLSEEIEINSALFYARKAKLTLSYV